GHVLRLGAKLLHLGDEVVVVEIEALGDGLEVIFLEGFAGEDEFEGGVIIDDGASVAVANTAAGSGNRHALHAILQRLFVVDLRVFDLQFPEAGDEEEEDGNGAVLEDGNFPGRETSIVVQRRFVLQVLFEVWIDRRKDHKKRANALNPYCSRLYGFPVSTGEWISRRFLCFGWHFRKPKDLSVFDLKSLDLLEA